MVRRPVAGPDDIVADGILTKSAHSGRNPQ